MSGRTLPGMPLAASDVFVCTNIDAAPLHAIVPAQRPARQHVHGWLILQLCPKCNATTYRYCSDHNAANWWFTHWGR